MPLHSLVYVDVFGNGVVAVAVVLLAHTTMLLPVCSARYDTEHSVRQSLLVQEPEIPHFCAP